MLAAAFIFKPFSFSIAPLLQFFVRACAETLKFSSRMIPCFKF
jgi:hypothetical protein